MVGTGILPNNRFHVHVYKSRSFQNVNQLFEINSVRHGFLLCVLTKGN